MTPGSYSGTPIKHYLNDLAGHGLSVVRTEFIDVRKASLVSTFGSLCSLSPSVYVVLKLGIEESGHMTRLIESFG